MNKENQKTEEEIESELDEEEKLEEIYGEDPHAKKRARGKHKERFGPTGGTRGAQQKRAEENRYYVRKKKRKNNF